MITALYIVFVLLYATYLLDAGIMELRMREYKNTFHN